MDTEVSNNKKAGGVAIGGLTTGIIGTVLGGLATMAAHSGAYSGILGGNSIAGAANDAAVLEMARKDAEIAQLKADAATDKKLVDVYTVLRNQDKEQDAKIADLNTRVTSLETSAPLREQIVLGQVQSVANAATNGIASLQAQITGIQNTVSNITKCVVPITAVCPQPMPQYNSWTAPTTPTAA